MGRSVHIRIMFSSPYLGKFIRYGTHYFMYCLCIIIASGFVFKPYGNLMLIAIRYNDNRLVTILCFTRLHGKHRCFISVGIIFTYDGVRPFLFILYFFEIIIGETAASSLSRYSALPFCPYTLFASLFGCGSQYYFGCAVLLFSKEYFSGFNHIGNVQHKRFCKLSGPRRVRSSCHQAFHASV